MYDGTDTLGTDGVSAGAEAEPHEAVASAMPAAAPRIDTIFTIFIVFVIVIINSVRNISHCSIATLYSHWLSASNNDIFLKRVCVIKQSLRVAKIISSPMMQLFKSN